VLAVGGVGTKLLHIFPLFNKRHPVAEVLSFETNRCDV
jgi:hypothetical protein